MKKLKILLITVLFLNILLSCENEYNEQTTKVDVKKELINLMNDYYLWYDQIPQVDTSLYPGPVELMEALKVNPPDKWSYVTTKTELNAYYNQGAYVGFGFGSGFNTNNELIITFVFKGSPLYAQGINRGWQIISINGTTPTPDNYSSLIGPSEAGLSKTFVFKSPLGDTQEFTFTKGEISMNTVLFDSVYTFGATKIGYFVLESFIANTKNELNSIFYEFKSKGVNELIVDLRYNGGGQVDVSKHLADLIGGSIAYGRVYAKSYHNDKHTNLNDYLLFSVATYSLSINRVIFITTNGSASASELVINGLKPFMDVILVGEKTHGKPAGMYTFTFNDPSIDWAFVPICFTLRNANNEGDYYNGIPVTIEAADDVMSAFGDVNEASLNASLSHLGVISKTSQKKGIQPFRSVVGKGLKAEIGAW